MRGAVGSRFASIKQAYPNRGSTHAATADWDLVAGALRAGKSHHMLLTLCLCTPTSKADFMPLHPNIKSK